MSSWVHGPDRGLAPVVKAEDDSPLPPDATFHPELVSSPQLRDKARSSAYGSVVPKIEKVVLEDNDLRPWEEPPTFRPELGPSELREKARSSSYGTAVPQKVAREAPTPSFKPELVTQTSKVSVQWSERARSSKYGSEVAKVSPPPPPPKPSFQPEFPKSAHREKYNSAVTSSKYGQVAATPPRGVAERPSTAPAREASLHDLRDSSKRPQTAGTRGTEEGRKFVDPCEERAKEGGFVLDGVNVGLMMRAQEQYPGIVRKANLLGSPRKLPGDELSRSLKEKAPSSKYGIAPPPRGDKPPEKAPEPRLTFSRASVLHSPLEPFQERSPLNEKVRSHSYGVAPPPKGERPPPKESEPKWTPSRSVMSVEPPPTPRSALNDKVASHHYGTEWEPGKGERKSVFPEPVWVPPSTRGGIPDPEPPRPRSANYSHIRSHYGSDYNPSANASQVEESY